MVSLPEYCCQILCKINSLFLQAFRPCERKIPFASSSILFFQRAPRSERWFPIWSRTTQMMKQLRSIKSAYSQLKGKDGQGIIGPRSLGIQHEDSSDPRSVKALEADLQTLDTEYSTLGDWMANGEQEDFSVELLELKKNMSILALYYHQRPTLPVRCHCKTQVGQGG